MSTALRERLDHGDDAPDLFFLRHRCGAWPRGFAAHIDDGGAGLDHVQRMVAALAEDPRSARRPKRSPA